MRDAEQISLWPLLLTHIADFLNFGKHHGIKILVNAIQRELHSILPVISTVICWPDFRKMTVEMSVEIVRPQNFSKLKFPWEIIFENDSSS